MNNEEKKLEYIEDKFDSMYKIGSEWVFVPSAGLGFKIVGVMDNGDLKLEKHYYVGEGCDKEIYKSTPIGVLRKSCELVNIYNEGQAKKKGYIDELKEVANKRK